MDHSVFGMVPSGERLYAVNAPLPQVDDGLIMHFVGYITENVT